MKKIIITTIVAIMFVILSAIGIVGAAKAFAADSTTIEKSFDSSTRELIAETEEMKNHFEELDSWSDGYITTKYFAYEVVDDSHVRIVVVVYSPLTGYDTTEDVVDINDVSAANADFEEMYELSFDEWMWS